MASFKILKTIETHTGGQPTRIVIGGLPDFSGQSVSEKRMCAKKNYDSIRKFLCFEPRGHAAMYSAYLVESNLADLGVIFCSQVGYDDMCGHGIIGVVTAIIEEGVKLDNLIQIGHNVKIGKNTAIAGLTAIAGSTIIGENCLIGGQCAITGHIKIGNNVRIAGNSGIGGNIKDNLTVQGIYAFNKQDFQRNLL